MKVFEMLGGKKEDIMKCAVGIECFHNSTLIFDDLPAMDNSPLRKGKATAHIKFGEANAVLGALFLENTYRRLINDSICDLHIPLNDTVEILREVDATSIDLIFGQYLDLNHLRNEEELEMVLKKKNQIFRSSFVLPALFLGRSDLLEILSSIGNHLSVAYQLFDDLRDLDSTEDIIGKPVGVDKDKNTSVYYYGENAIRTRLDKLFADIISQLEQIPKSEEVIDLVRLILSQKA